MKKLTTSELRKTFLGFFVERGHRLVKSDSLVPANDPSVLFTSAGMNQFKDNFLGRTKELRRATSVQKCLRTGDLEQVGLTPYHHTFFEMLGNFSFGDYFKKEAIEWSWEFVTKVLEIPRDRLWVSVYEDDDEALRIWREYIGLPADMIQKFGPKENFWPANAIQDGPNGPCGPCSEIYFKKDNNESVELWNLVFTQFDRRDNGVLEPLPNKNIDTGMGLERMSSVLQGVDSNFKTDIFIPIVDAVRKATELGEERLIYTVADHARAVSFCISDGVLPSNDGRGYVVRKLIRRCLYLAQKDNLKPFLYKIVSSVAGVMADQYPEVLERRDNIAQIIKAEEEKYIRNILEGGAERLNSIIEEIKQKGAKEMPAEFVAELYGTYGILPEFSIEAAGKAGLSVDKERFASIFKMEQDKSRASSKMAGSIFNKGSVVLKKCEFAGYETDSCDAEIIQIIKGGVEVDEAHPGDTVGVVLDKTTFYAESGGQVGDMGSIALKDEGLKIIVSDTKKQDNSIIHLGEVKGEGRSVKVGDAVTVSVDLGRREAIKRAHTATHILQAALRQVLGPHVQQAGSLVDPDRFRFDFTHFKDINDEEMQDLQKLLNEYVIKNDTVTARVMSKDEAQKTGAIALFGEKYEDTVRVISVGDYSKEFCGGTHLDLTGNIGLILITSESSVGSGLRRIEALTGNLAYREVFSKMELLEEISKTLKTVSGDILSTLKMKEARLKDLEKVKAKRDVELIKEEAKKAEKAKKKIKDIFLIIEELEDRNPSLLRNTIDFLKKLVPEDGVFVVSSVFDGSAYFACGSTSRIPANILLQKMLSSEGGSGGGRKDFAQGGIKDASKISKVLKEAQRLIEAGEV